MHPLQNASAYVLRENPCDRNEKGACGALIAVLQGTERVREILQGMRRFPLGIVLGCLLLIAGQALAQAPAPSPDNAFPPQLQMRVPQAPTAFNNGGMTYLVYELHVTNFTAKAMTLSRIEVLDATAPHTPPVAAFSGSDLAKMLRPLAGTPAGSDATRIAAGTSTVVYFWIGMNSGVTVPARLLHRVIFDNTTAEGAVVGTHTADLHVLRPPLEGDGWQASDGPGNDPDNDHRYGLVVIGGNAVISRRFAIDWLLSRNGVTYSGNFQDVHSHYSYGQPVLAVADATVIAARDGLPDNVPGHFEAFHPAVSLNLDTIRGNTVTLDLGSGQYAYYFHFAPGSGRVKVGDHVRAGQVLAQVGASGDAREPHLHFEVTNSPIPMAGEGLPYLFDSYQVETQGGLHPEVRSLPLDNMIVDFDKPGK